VVAVAVLAEAVVATARNVVTVLSVESAVRSVRDPRGLPRTSLPSPLLLTVLPPLPRPRKPSPPAREARAVVVVVVVDEDAEVTRAASNVASALSVVSVVPAVAQAVVRVVVMVDAGEAVAHPARTTLLLRPLMLLRSRLLLKGLGPVSKHAGWQENHIFTKLHVEIREHETFDWFCCV
jgi:hypothetical protein